METVLQEILRGRAIPFGPKGEKSGIAKTPCPGPVRVGTEGLDGDQQGDRKHHGGPDKAVHHYPFDHYGYWREQLRPGPEILDSVGAFGENISTTGLTERDVHLGDIFSAGTAVLQVSQARQPCWKLNLRFTTPDMARRVQDSGRTGWYYRVLEPGSLARGDVLHLRERPLPDWPLSRLLGILYGAAREDYAALEEMAELDLLTPSWRNLARKRLKNRKTESWTRRLTGRAPES